MIPASESAGRSVSDEAAVPPLVRVVAVPVLPQLVAVGGIHRRDQLEGVERLAARVDLLEDDADGFLRRRAIERDHGHAVVLEVLQHLALECTERPRARPRSGRRASACRSRPATRPSRRPAATGYISACVFLLAASTGPAPPRGRSRSRMTRSSGTPTIASSRSTAGSSALRMSM